MIGRPAPDLSFQDENGQPVSLRSMRGHPVLLVFLRWLG
jgi:peroxiredoxin